MKTSIPKICTDDKKVNMTKSDDEKANVLADFFSSVVTIDTCNDTVHPEINPVKDVPELDEIIITTDTVKKKLENLKINKSPGPDRLHPRIN